LEIVEFTGRWRCVPLWEGGEGDIGCNNVIRVERWRYMLLGRECGGGRKQVAASGAACSEHVTRVHVPVCEELWRSDEPERNVDKCIFGAHEVENGRL
jgi:hypothetical protein